MHAASSCRLTLICGNSTECVKCKCSLAWRNRLHDVRVLCGSARHCGRPGDALLAYIMSTIIVLMFKGSIRRGAGC